MKRNLLLSLSLLLYACGGGGGTTLPAEGDYNGDGKYDLVIGLPGGGPWDGGMIAIYDMAPGMTSVATSQLFLPTDPVFGLPVGGGGDYGYGFGYSLAPGDFDGDGFGDLGIGLPGYLDDTGNVTVLYGAANGLEPRPLTGSPIWDQDDFDVLSWRNDNDRLGHSFVTGDFDNDGCSDLAIGVPSDEIVINTDTGEILPGEPSPSSGIPFAFLEGGAVHVIYGSQTGIDITRHMFIHQGYDGILEGREYADGFGAALAVGDFDNDGVEDLAIGVPGEEISTTPINNFGAGIVQVLYGTAGTGLTTTGQQLLEKNNVDTTIPIAGEDGFGFALASGDFDGDGTADLAIGAPGDNPGSLAHGGGVYIAFGQSGSGLETSGGRYLAQSFSWIEGDAGTDHLFGYSLACNDINGDAMDDLVVGSPLSQPSPPGPSTDKGSVSIIYGYPRTSPEADDTQFFTEADMPDVPTANRFGFGLAVAAQDYNGDGFADVAIGAPYRDEGGTLHAGGVYLLFADGGGSHLTTLTGSVAIHRSFTGLIGPAEAGDFFGAGLPKSGALLETNRVTPYVWFGVEVLVP